jgi:two-component system, NarL family, response regulator LiaR
MSPFTGKPLRLAIVNDYEIVVAGIARMLADHRDRVVVVEQASRRAVLSDVDIILCDMFAHIGGHGADPTDMLGRGAKVVVFTWAVPPDPGSRMADGVAGYLSKGLSAVELVESLEAIHRGEPVRSAHVEDHAVGAGDWPGREAGLTHREAEILALIVRGLSNKEIAEAMFLSINSVKTYIRTAYRKIGVTRRQLAVIWALRHGFTAEIRRAPVPPNSVSRTEESTTAAGEG